MIRTMANFGLFVFLSAIVIHIPLIASQNPTYRSHVCSTSTNYTARSAFPANLNVTLSSLYTNSNRSGGFYNTSAGQNSDRANGLFLCRGDISPDLCQRCIRATSQEIVSRCPNQKEAIIWYDECMLRYSNSPIFSYMEESPRVSLWNRNNITEPERFNSSLANLMKDLVTRAVSAKDFFATTNVNATAFDALYGLMQCTPDITPTDCNICLAGCVSDIPTCCNGKRGGGVLKPSCNMRYETFPFYEAPPSPLSLPPSVPSPNSGDDGNGTSKTAVIVTIPTTVFIVLVAIFIAISRKWKRKEGNQNIHQEGPLGSLHQNFSIVRAATNNFSDSDKLGHGGFGSVYKGKLLGGEQIAVKRLEGRSMQGVEEFKNEIALISRLQHKNLVRLLGYSLHREERLLVYEFVPNASLDRLLFDPNRCAQLDWRRRYKIIYGIARGILYLHEESRLKIIHRDLKPGNILLDGELNPKISDFGMARLFGLEQSKCRTQKIAGTYGYMAPEYAKHGQFSIKSDVFSFGVMVLELVSGKNISVNCSGHMEHLLSYAWRRWREGRPLDLRDQRMTGGSRTQILKCIHIGLLCVQEDAARRPTMSSVLLMLSSHSSSLPSPSQPGFYMGLNEEAERPVLNSDTRTACYTVNQVSITDPYPR